tara:strand:+ start:311 stop:898 length:588 start_codon:yes stop_codon:yes gene_type:complete
MHNIVNTNQYFTKTFNNHRVHNKKLGNLFLNKEYELKPVSTEYNRIPGIQTINDLYNIFEWQYTSIKWLSKNIYNFINELFMIENINNYFIHGWFNVLNTDESLGWHIHWDRFGKCRDNNITTISGHYIIDAEQSSTIYENFTIPTKNGTCTIFDPKLKHKTDYKKDGLRTSIAFDIVPNMNCLKGKPIKLGDII